MKCPMCGHEHFAPECPECGEEVAAPSQRQSRIGRKLASDLTILRRMAIGYLATTLGSATAISVYFDMPFGPAMSAGFGYGAVPSIGVSVWLWSQRSDQSLAQGVATTVLAAMIGVLFVTSFIALMYLMFRWG